MKRERTKGFIAGVVITILLSGLFTSAYAGTQKQAVLNYSGIKITLDGAVIRPTDVNGNYIEPFIIGGTTYLPVRGIASTLGLNVDWDGTTNTVILTTPSGNTIPSQPTPPTQSITTTSELESYLNQTMGELKTPLGTHPYKIDVYENPFDFFPQDFEIKVSFTEIYPWYNLKYSNSYSDADKKAALKTFREFQEKIYQIAITYFPDKKITGCYYDDYFKYNLIHEGYRSTRALTWRNYSWDITTSASNAKLSSFHWFSDNDDYIFNY